MPKVLDDGTYRVDVYANDSSPHHLPHCHVYWDRDECSSVVSLPDLGSLGRTMQDLAVEETSAAALRPAVARSR